MHGLWVILCYYSLDGSCASVQRSGTGAARRVCAATGAARLYSGRHGASVQRSGTGAARRVCAATGAARLCSGRRPPLGGRTRLV